MDINNSIEEIVANINNGEVTVNEGYEISAAEKMKAMCNDIDLVNDEDSYNLGDFEKDNFEI